MIRFVSQRMVMWLLGALGAVLLVSAGFATPSHALTERGPTDPRMRYALEYSYTTQATSMQIPIYYRRVPTTAQLMNIQDFSRDTSVYDVWLRVRARSATGVGYVATDSNVTGNKTFSIPASAFAYDNASGMYRAVLDFDMQNRGTTRDPTKFIHFQLLLADTSAYIAYGSDSDGGYFQAVSRDYVLTDGLEPPEVYNLYMATPCDIRSNTTQPVSVYDLDHRNLDNGYYGVTVRIYDVTNGEPGVLERTFNGDSYPTSMGQGGTLSYGQVFEPRHRYRMELSNIVPRNVIQYNFPFDNIAYVVNCDTVVTGSVSQSLDLIPDTTVLMSGQQLTGRFLGSSTATVPAPINYDARIWYDANNNSRFDTGEDTVFSRVESSGAGRLAAGANNVELFRNTFTTDISRGSRICFSWSITPAHPGLTDSDPAADVRCVFLGFKPRVNVWGNDLRVGGALTAANNVSTAQVMGNTNLVSGSLRGSWVEYGIFAPNTVVSMASGSRFMAPSVAVAQSDWSKLTFANVGGYGRYTSGAALGVLPDVRTYFTTATLPASVTRVATNSASISSYTPNRVVVDGGTVTITGDIIAPAGPITSGVSGLTQMVIIANGDIRIRSNVQRIDAWLIAPNGTIETCQGAGVALSTSVCNQQLTITGPIMANHLNLRRTFGAGDEYAETINLRADAYVWMRNISSQTGSWQTKFTTELPPRY